MILFGCRYVLAKVVEHDLPVAVEHDAEDGDDEQHSGQDLVVVLQPLVVMLNANQCAEEATQPEVRHDGEGLGERGNLARQDVAEVEHQRDPGQAECGRQQPVLDHVPQRVVEDGQQDEAHDEREERGHQDLARAEHLDDAAREDEHRNCQQVAGEQHRPDDGLEHARPLYIIRLVRVRQPLGQVDHVRLVDRVDHAPQRAETDCDQARQPAAAQAGADTNFCGTVRSCHQSSVGDRSILSGLSRMTAAVVYSSTNSMYGCSASSLKKTIQPTAPHTSWRPKSATPVAGSRVPITTIVFSSVSPPSRQKSSRERTESVLLAVGIERALDLHGSLAVRVALLVLLVRIDAHNCGRHDHRLLSVRHAIVVVVVVLHVRYAVVIVIAVLRVRDAVVVVVRILVVRDTVAVQVVLVALARIVHVQYTVVVIVHVLRVRNAVVIVIVVFRVRDAIVVVVRILVVRNAVAVEIVRHRATLQRVRDAVVVVVQVLLVRNAVIVIVRVLRIGNAVVVVIVILRVRHAVSVQIVGVRAILHVRHTIVIVVRVLRVRNAVIVVVRVVLVRDAVVVVVRVLIVRNAVTIEIVELGLALECIRDAIVIIIYVHRVRNAVVIVVVVLRVRDAIIIVVRILVVRNSVAVQIVRPCLALQLVRDAIVVVVHILRIRDAIIVVIVVLRIRDAVIVARVRIARVRDAIVVVVRVQVVRDTVAVGVPLERSLAAAQVQHRTIVIRLLVLLLAQPRQLCRFGQTGVAVAFELALLLARVRTIFQIQQTTLETNTKLFSRKCFPLSSTAAPTLCRVQSWQTPLSEHFSCTINAPFRLHRKLTCGSHTSGGGVRLTANISSTYSTIEATSVRAVRMRNRLPYANAFPIAHLSTSSANTNGPSSATSGMITEIQ
uniref:Uncharacterized protein n=1 Tax=Anopheles atroparvus TaxID=41427 RepID=A0A182IQ14_ANOAO